MDATLPLNKSRCKRLKVVSACSECRRKKTKCNGESPCTGCIKANVECKYVTSQKIRSTTSTTIATNLTSTSTAPFRPMLSSPVPEKKPKVEAIEERLVVIEDIIRVLLKGGSSNGTSGDTPFGYHHRHHQHYQATGSSGSRHSRSSSSSSSSSSAPLAVFDSGASCGYHPPTVHAPHAQNWHFARDPIAPTPRRPTSAAATQHSSYTAMSSSAFHLPPLTSASSICSLSSSSSTSTASSRGSTGPSIRSLLNNVIVDPVTPPSSSPGVVSFQHHKEGRAFAHHRQHQYYRPEYTTSTSHYYHPSP